MDQPNALETVPYSLESSHSVSIDYSSTTPTPVFHCKKKDCGFSSRELKSLVEHFEAVHLAEKAE